MADGGLTKVRTDEYAHKENHALPITYNFATTIYASQGQTVSKVFLLDNPQINRKLAYVGASRHTDSMNLYLDKEELGGRIRKKIEREKQKALKKIERERSKEKVALFSEVDDHRLEAQYPDFSPTHVFTEREYLGVVASSWNAFSMNQTVTMARKQRGGRQKRDLHWKSPLAPWYASIEKAKEDPLPSVLTYETTELSSIEEQPHPHTPPVSKNGFFGKLFYASDSKQTFTNSNLSSSSRVFRRDPDPFERWSDLDSGLIQSAKDLIWIENRHHEPRLVGLDPYSFSLRSQYDLNGCLKVGDGEIPVYANEHRNNQTPFLLVHDFREVALSYIYYRTKFKSSPEKIPNLVLFLQDSNLESLKPWLPPSAYVYVAHGKSAGSLERSLKTSEMLHSIGISNELRPKISPSPQTLITPKAKI